jgi:hypothetical protein
VLCGGNPTTELWESHDRHSHYYAIECSHYKSHDNPTTIPTTIPTTLFCTLGIETGVVWYCVYTSQDQGFCRALGAGADFIFLCVLMCNHLPICIICNQPRKRGLSPFDAHFCTPKPGPPPPAQTTRTASPSKNRTVIKPPGLHAPGETRETREKGGM